MEFCKQCGSILVRSKDGSDNVLKCRKCEYTVKDYKPMQITENIRKDPLDDVVIIEKSDEALPKTKASCPKCGHKEATWWVQTTRSADEAPTLFLRCIECKHSWREYG